jgi:hydrogenase nickel incorporation protein HypA/HybF
MHEWALAEAVITAATQLAEKESLAQITEINIKIGQMQQIERPILRFALSQLKPTNFKKTKIHITNAKTKLKCRVCGQNWIFKKKNLNKNTTEAIHFVPEVAHTFIRCPRCGSPDFEIGEGRGIWLESIKGEKQSCSTQE